VSLIVSDTTPVNYLILIGQIDVLPRLFGDLLLPPAVIREMLHSKAPWEVNAWASNLPSWVEVKAPRSEVRLGIGAGEDEAIALALELGSAALLIDDRKARAAARSRGLVTIGTLALLDLADEAGWLNFQDALQRLRNTSFHIDGIVAEALLQRSRSRNESAG
jgi:predicted nucleic acid-binding protein